MQTVRKLDNFSVGDAERARATLVELDAAHAGLLRELAAMQAIQERPDPKRDQWAYARWQLSRASRRRRSCVLTLYPLAHASATSTEAVHIRQLQAQDPVMLAASRAHVETWTPERISTDWGGYCAASRVLRQSMIDRIRAEKDVLVPLLARIAGRLGTPIVS